MRYWIVAVLVAVVLTAVGLFFFHPQSPINRTDGVAPVAVQQVPTVDLNLPLVDLEGEWAGESNGLKFKAEITGSIIKVDMFLNEGLSTVYWFGSFRTSEEAGKTIASTAEEHQSVLSTDKSKDFKIEKDAFSFQFQMMGEKKTVEMRRV